MTGIKDPVLARPKEGGGLEILSGQRRHLIGTELNYPIPTIIQRIDDADAKFSSRTAICTAIRSALMTSPVL